MVFLHQTNCNGSACNTSHKHRGSKRSAVSVWTFPEAFSSSAFAVLSMYLACLPFEEEGGGGYRGDIMKMDDAVTLG